MSTLMVLTAVPDCMFLNACLSGLTGSLDGTELLRDVLGKNPATTVVVIDEVETENWGIGGESVSVRRGRGE